MIKPKVSIEIFCSHNNCDRTLEIEIPAGNFRDSSSVTEDIIGVSAADVLHTIYSKGWSIESLDRGGIYNWSAECFLHGMSRDIRREINRVAKEEEWSDEFKDGFIEALERHPEIGPSKYEWL